MIQNVLCNININSAHLLLFIILHSSLWLSVFFQTHFLDVANKSIHYALVSIQIFRIFNQFSITTLYFFEQYICFFLFIIFFKLCRSGLNCISRNSMTNHLLTISLRTLTYDTGEELLHLNDNLTRLLYVKTSK